MKLRNGLRVEQLEDEAVVFDPTGEVVHRVSGSGLTALALLRDGVSASDIPDALVEAIDRLAEAGLVEDTSMLPRRTVLATGGAAWTAATVATFALADPAAAAGSGCPGGVTPTDPAAKKYETAGPETYTTGVGVTSLLVRAWGGGGGGGGGGWSCGGGGAGGGGYAYTAALEVLPCTEYAVTVGAGGAGGGGGSAIAAGKNGGNGTDSVFGSSILKAAGGKGGGRGALNSGGSGGSGGTTGSSTGDTRHAGGNGGGGAVAAGGGGGGGGAGTTGNGGAGSGGGVGNASGGAGGPGNPGSPDMGAGGLGRYGGGSGGAGTVLGGAGGGGSGSNTAGGTGARGAVWVGF